MDCTAQRESERVAFKLKQLSEQLKHVTNGYRVDISGLLHFKHAFVPLLMCGTIKFKFKTMHAQRQILQPLTSFMEGQN